MAKASLATEYRTNAGFTTGCWSVSTPTTAATLTMLPFHVNYASGRDAQLKTTIAGNRALRATSSR